MHAAARGRRWACPQAPPWSARSACSATRRHRKISSPRCGNSRGQGSSVAGSAAGTRRPDGPPAWALTGTPVVLAGERPDVPEILPAFDVFALPSRYEGLPTAVVEAMTCGVPVVATAINAVPDNVVPGEMGLLVPPCRPDLLALAVRYLLDSPETARGWRRPPGLASGTPTAPGGSVTRPPPTWQVPAFGDTVC